MKKKLFLALLSLSCLFVCTAGLAACADGNGNNGGNSNGNDNKNTHEHSYSVEIVDPTCTEKGYTIHKCSCGDSYNDTYTNALGHDYAQEFTVDTQPTCTSKGSKSKHCSRCDSKSEVTEMPVSQHKFGSEFTVDVQPDCTKAGSKSKHCTDCDAKDEITEIGALGHDFEENFTVDSNPDCTEAGSKSKHCSRCDAKDEITVIGALGHDFDENFTVDINPGCTEAGSKSRHCSRCDAKDEITEIAALGHNFGAFSYDETEHWRRCSRCGNNEQEEHSVDSNECAVCKYIKDGTNGLEYALSTDGRYYIVTGIGTATDASVKIPSYYNGLPVTEIAELAFAESEITEITVPAGITKIGWGAFSSPTLETLRYNAENCQRNTNSYGFGINTYYQTNIKVIIGANVISLPADFSKILSPSTGGTFGWFFPNIVSVEVEEGSSLKTIGKNAFYYCLNLTDVQLPDGLTTIESGAFYGCESLKSIHLPQSLTFLDSFVFSECVSLEELTVDENNPVYRGAGNCIIDIQDKVLVVGCKTSVIPSDGSVTSIGKNAFEKTYALTHIILPSGIEKIGDGAFSSCTALKSITFPETVKEIGKSAFANCDSVKSIHIPAGVAVLGDYAFSDCDLLEEFTVDPDSAYFASADGVLYNKQKTQIIEIPCCVKGEVNIPQGVTELPQSVALNTYKNLTSLGIPESLTQIEELLNKSIALESITVNEKNKVYASLDGILYNKAMTEILFIPANISGNIRISDKAIKLKEEQFKDRSLLNGVFIPKSVTEIGNKAFYGCESLESITVDPNNTAYYSQDGILYNKAATRFIWIPDSIKGVVTVADGITVIPNQYDYYDPSFMSKESLTGIILGKNITEIASGAFWGCVSLEEVYFNCENCADLPGWGSDVWQNCGTRGSGIVFTVGKDAKHIPDNFFNWESSSSAMAHKLVKVIFEDGGACESIGVNAFKDCNLIQNIEIPQTLKSIGMGAFSYCTSLESVIIPETVESIGGEAFGYCDGTIVYCEPQSKPDGWSDYFAKIIIWDYKNNSIAADGARYVDFGGLRYALKNGEAAVASQLAMGLKGDIVIPSNIDYDSESYPVTEIKNSAFVKCADITSVSIPESVTSLGDYLFEYCGALTSVNITESALDYNIYDFGGCDNMQFNEYGNALYLGNKDNPYIVLIKAKDTAITSVTINENSLAIANYAFLDCEKLTEAVIPDGVLSIGYCAFQNCSALKNIEIANSVVKLNSTYTRIFEGCPIENAIVPRDALKQIEKDNLKSIVITNGESIRSLFTDYPLLESITFPATATFIREYFTGCPNLSEITVESGNAVYHSKDNCIIETATNTLVAACAPFVIPPYVTTIGDSALQYSTVKSLKIPSGVTHIGNAAFWSASTENVELPDTLQSIGESAFYSNGSLMSITIPASVTYIGRDAFSYCSLLKIYCEAESKPSGWDSRWNSSDCKTVWNCKNNDVADDGNIYTVYEGLCYAIKDGEAAAVQQPYSLSGDVIIHSVITYKDIDYPVTAIAERAFYGRGIASLTIPSGVISTSYYSLPGEGGVVYCEAAEMPAGWYDKFDCPVVWDYKNNDVAADGYIYVRYEGLSYALKDGEATVIKQNGNLSGVVEIAQSVEYKGAKYAVTRIADNAFMSYANVTEFRLNEGLKSIGERAFSMCTSLKTVNIPEGVTSIGEFAFESCESLTAITIPDSVTAISNYTFMRCVSLKDVTLGKNVKTVGMSAFSSCGIKNLILPSSLKIVESYAFDDCNGCNVYFTGTKAQWNSIGIKESGNYYLINTVHYFYSEERPSDYENNYWHYGEDGVTPEKW